MKAKFFGGAGTVTGSKTIIESNGVQILIDCGLHGSQEYIESVVSNDSVYKTLVNDLYPRDKDIPSKLIYNCFGNKEKSSLYFTISKINQLMNPEASQKKINEQSILIQQLTFENDQLKEKVEYLNNKIKTLITSQLEKRQVEKV